jgi:integrase
MARVWRQIRKDLPLETVELLEKYDTEMVNLGIGKSTRIKQFQILLTITRKVNKNWTDVSKPDIDRVIREIMTEYGDVNGDETETSRDFKKILKLFFRWLRLGSRDVKQVGDPVETKGIRLRKPKDKITRENLIKEEDRTKLLHACGENIRDRAFIDVHLEAGTRPGEILSLQIKHVEFDNVGARIHVDGKTGARPIRLIRSTPNLAAWIKAHPYGNNPEAPLWILVDPAKYGQPMTYVAAKAMVARRCRMANLPKRVNLKLFRHSAATAAAKFLTDAEMKKRHGWTRTSNMPARYVHMVDADVEEKILSHYGISKKEEMQPIKPKMCVFCDVPNSPESTLCSNCGRSLELETAIKIDTQKETIGKYLTQEDLQSVEKRMIEMSENNARLEKKFDDIIRYLQTSSITI